MSNSEDKEHLLPDDHDASINNGEPSSCWRLGKSSYVIPCLLLCLVFSIMVNILTLVRSWQQPIEPLLTVDTRQGRPSYCQSTPTTRLQAHVLTKEEAGLQYDVPKTYTYHTKYWNETGITSDEHWEAISIDPAVIAVTPEWAASKGLPSSWKFPWDQTKEIYFIKVFHQLHCLKLVRQALKAWERGEEATKFVGHIGHCLDALRQDLMCHADDTPMRATRPRHSLGDGQESQCMDFDKLVAWAQDPDRYACHKHIHEYEPIIHGIERFAFCPPDSPYYPAMSAYFERHGHKDPVVP